MSFKWYLRCDSKAFNHLAETAKSPIRWKDKTEANGTGNGFFEQGELSFLPGTSKKIIDQFVHEDGTYKEAALLNRLVEIARPAFKSTVYHLLLDKGRQDGTVSAENLAYKHCQDNPPLDGSTVDDCQALVFESMEHDPHVIHSGFIHGGKIAGLEAQVPRLASLGFDTIYTSSTMEQARSYEPHSASSSHGFHPRDLGEWSLSPYLGEAGKTPQETLTHLYNEVARLGLTMITDLPTRGTIPVEGDLWTQGWTIMDAGLVFYNGELVGNANAERLSLGLKPGEHDLQWRTRNDPNYFFVYGSSVNMGLHHLSGTPKAEEYYDMIAGQMLWSLGCPNPMPNSVPQKLFRRKVRAEARLFSDPHNTGLPRGLNGYRLDSGNDNSPRTLLPLVSEMRRSFPGPAQIFMEFLGTGDSSDLTGAGAQMYLLDPDPMNRLELFFFGARDAAMNTFTNDRVSLKGLEDIEEVYARYQFDPRVLSGLNMFVDNHDKPTVMDAVMGDGPLRRMSEQDLVSMTLFMGIFPSSVFIYYPLLPEVRDRDDQYFTRDMWNHRPSLKDLPTATDPSTYTPMERAVWVMDFFREDHYKAIAWGEVKAGLKDGWTSKGVHSVRRKFMDVDEVAMFVLRAPNDASEPEDGLKKVRSTLTPGLYIDRLTGQKFKIGVQGEILPQAGSGTDKIWPDIQYTFFKNGRRLITSSSSVTHKGMGEQFQLETRGNTALLPDGRWMPVNPIASGTCDPVAIYRANTRHTRTHPYSGCATLVTKGSKVVDIQVDDAEASAAIRPLEDGTGTLPDGQYFLDRTFVDEEGEVCKTWVKAKATPNEVPEVCGSIVDEILWVKDGRVDMLPRTRVMYLERVK